MRSAAHVGVGESERRQLDARAVALPLPLDPAVQAFERDARLGKDLRQVDRDLARGERKRALGLRRLDRAAEAAEAGNAFVRPHGELAKAAPRREPAGRVERTAPFEA